MVQVRFGRIGLPGIKDSKSFWTDQEAVNFYKEKIYDKLNKGYREQTASGTSSSRQAPPNPATQKQLRTSTKSTYKIYGHKGKAPAHTRYQGKVYGAPSDTKFRAGNMATVALGSDGRLSVHDPATGHTQHWASEAADKLIDDLVINEILNPSGDLSV